MEPLITAWERQTLSKLPELSLDGHRENGFPKEVGARPGGAMLPAPPARPRAPSWTSQCRRCRSILAGCIPPALGPSTPSQDAPGRGCFESVGFNHHLQVNSATWSQVGHVHGEPPENPRLGDERVARGDWSAGGPSAPAAPGRTGRDAHSQRRGAETCLLLYYTYTGLTLHLKIRTGSPALVILGGVQKLKPEKKGARPPTLPSRSQAATPQPHLA